MPNRLFNFESIKILVTITHLFADLEIRSPNCVHFPPCRRLLKERLEGILVAVVLKMKLTFLERNKSLGLASSIPTMSGIHDNEEFDF